MKVKSRTLLEPSTYSAMQELSRVALTGENIVPEGARPDRVQVYHDLVWGAFEDTLEKGYPLAFALLGALPSAHAESAWLELIKAFVASAPKTSPLLWQMPAELVEFSHREQFAERFNTPWLDDLLRFEWMEIEVHMMPDGELPDKFRAYGESPDERLSGKLVLNPDFQILVTEYPVFRSLEPHVLNTRGRYFVLGFRHRETCKVHFVELTPQLVVCVEWLAEEPRTLDSVFETLSQVQPEPVDGLSLLRSLYSLAREGMILGSIESGTAAPRLQKTS